MAVNDFSGTLGYHGLAGAVALSGVVTAAAWIRGLDPQARLPRCALWLFIVPAGCAAAADAAAFSSGPDTDILTGFAAVLTVGAVLVVRKLESAATLLAGAGLIALGTALITYAAAFLADRGLALPGAPEITAFGPAAIAFGAAAIAFGAAAIAFGAALLAGRKELGGAGVIAGTVGVMALGAAVIPGHPGDTKGAWMAGAFFSALGAGGIAYGARIIAGREELFGWLIEIAATLKERKAGHRALAGAAAMVFGAVWVVDGAGAIASRFELFGASAVALGAGGIAYGVRIIGPQAIVALARRVIDWATKPPGSR
jgi:hypothetical protein